MLNRILAVAFACFATPLFAETVFYVKPDAVGAETDGTSWDTATSFTNALALAGANVPASVYVAKGAYQFRELTATVAPGVSVYGGFSGADASETIATRDLKANASVVYWYSPYWRWQLWKAGSTGKYVEPRASFPTQTSGSGTGIPVLNEDGTFNVPDPTDEEVYWYADRGGKVFASGDDSAEATAHVVLDGLTVVGAVLFKRVSATVRNCRFFGDAGVGATVWTHGRTLLVEDTDFEWGNDAAVSTYNANTGNLGYVPTVTMRNVNVRHYSPCNQWGSGLSLPSATGIVENCVFEGNWNLRTNDGGGPPIVYGNGYTSLKIANSSFIGNCVSTNASCIVDLPVYMPAVVSNCLFLSNRVVGDRLKKAGVTASIVNAGRNDAIIYGCSFVSNVVDRWDAEAPSGATTLPCAIVKCGYVSKVRNCTFEGNRVRATTSVEGVTPIMATVLWLGNSNDAGAIFGNTFCNNDAPTGEFVVERKCPVRVFNSILWNDSDSYVPVANVGTDANSRLTFRNCVVKNLDASAGCLTDCEDNQTGDPRLGELTAAGNVLVRHPSTGGSARRKGVQLYYDSRAEPFVAFRNAAGTGYVRCDTLGASGLTEPYTAIPDALGVFAREGRSPDIGAVQALSAGILMIFR